jgi:protein gp37
LQSEQVHIDPQPRFIFTCSWSDFFITEADKWRAEAWEIIRRTPEFTYLILTKRPDRIGRCLPADWNGGYPNVWLGTSAENQKYADQRIPELLRVPAVKHFLSAEPLLGADQPHADGFSAMWNTVATFSARRYQPSRI